MTLNLLIVLMVQIVLKFRTPNNELLVFLSALSVLVVKREID